MIAPSRKFIKEGSFKKNNGEGSDCLVFLFNDIIIVAREKLGIRGKDHLKLKMMFELDKCLAHSVYAMEVDKPALQFILQKTDGKECIKLCARDEGERSEWLSTINTAIVNVQSPMHYGKEGKN